MATTFNKHYRITVEPHCSKPLKHGHLVLMNVLLRHKLHSH